MDDLVTNQEIQQLEVSMKTLAEDWRRRLADPQVKEQIKRGTLEVSPMVKQLLKAFPATSEK